ncbi:AzlD domain-containing protein [Bacillus sp. AGMB 02131]|uniref:AzlD domain-containing protein n=1 Tax=Peribacillus faecalis TaxID=2772559 RepID=A0A927HE78_9BACI|nr:AzlD domain-containing protein [Peribacillus faecalis]MBD3110228.1 AzlD domain-containing protein [Peribacillus faecalis]
MNVDLTVLLVILGCALVTVIPRVVPFILVKNVELPKPVIKWLSFIPICILTALVADSVLIQEESRLLVDWPVFVVIIPTVLISIWTKSLSITVLVGIVMMAGVRFLL